MRSPFLLAVHVHPNRLPASGVSRDRIGVPEYISQFIPALVNESEAALYGVLPASKAELEKHDMKLLAGLKTALAAEDAKSATQDAKFAALEARLDNFEGRKALMGSMGAMVKQAQQALGAQARRVIQARMVTQYMGALQDQQAHQAAAHLCSWARAISAVRSDHASRHRKTHPRPVAAVSYPAPQICPDTCQGGETCNTVTTPECSSSSICSDSTQTCATNNFTGGQCNGFGECICGASSNTCVAPGPPPSCIPSVSQCIAPDSTCSSTAPCTSPSVGASNPGTCSSVRPGQCGVTVNYAAVPGVSYEDGTELSRGLVPTLLQCALKCNDGGAACTGFEYTGTGNPGLGGQVCIVFRKAASGTPPQAVGLDEGRTTSYLQTVNGYAIIQLTSFSGTLIATAPADTSITTCPTACQNTPACTFAVFDTAGATCTLYNGAITTATTSTTATSFFLANTQFTSP
ncbi:hypothetical protein WJX75_007891 [Coccomyxa subellipsoidea]|uniref:Apple domain-containing protein n=1 Tax=Coccomyxa subellipsoidea TaxID=248742 RepID=A0ABR2YNF9_9CHLO